MNTVGRNSKLTDELEKSICNILENGTSIKDACALAGIGERTFYEWVAIGNAHLNGEDHARMPHKIVDRDRFAQFAQTATRARATMRDNVVKTMVSRARAGDMTAAMFLLERSDPENWGRQTKVIHEFNAQEIAQLRQIKAILDKHGTPASDLFADLIAELAAQDAEHT
jgi:hypothetical protein